MPAPANATPQPDENLTARQRSDIVAARAALLDAASGHSDADHATAAALLDRVLAMACDHDPAHRHTRSAPASGRPLTTCPGCGIAWYSDYEERLADWDSADDPA